MTHKIVECNFEEVISQEKKALISGPFGSSIGKRFFRDAGVPVIRGNNLSRNTIKFKDEGFVFLDQEKADALGTYAIKEDIVFTAVGTLGQVGIIGDDCKFEKYIISNKQLRVRVDKSKILPLFVYYWFSAPFMVDVINMRNVGSTVPLINLTILRGLPIYYPENLKVQTNIVTFLDAIYQKIDLNNKINAELESMAKLIYDYWFVQFDFPISAEQAKAMGKPKLEGRPYKSSGGKMVWNEELRREIPEGWGVKLLSDIAEIKAGGDKPKIFSSSKTNRCNVPIYSNGVRNEGLYGYTDKARFYKQCITVTGRGANVGFSVLRNSPFLPIIRLLVVTPELPFYSKFLHERIKDINFQNSGSAQPQITVPQISSLIVLMPNSELIQKYDNITSPGIKAIENNKEQNQELSSLRDWLLPMLMNGQVKVGE